MKVMDDEEDAETPNNPLKTELLLLSHEIQSTLTPPLHSDENTTSVSIIQETPEPILSNPRNTSEPIVNDPRDTFEIVFNISKNEEPDVTTTDDEENVTVQALLRRVKAILENSGIELVLPIDCGRVSPAL